MGGIRNASDWLDELERPDESEDAADERTWPDGLAAVKPDGGLDGAAAMLLEDRLARMCLKTSLSQRQTEALVLMILDLSDLEIEYIMEVGRGTARRHIDAALRLAGSTRARLRTGTPRHPGTELTAVLGRWLGPRVLDRLKALLVADPEQALIDHGDRSTPESECGSLLEKPGEADG